MKIKVIVFDFDGVIAESVDVKTQAFAEIFKDCGEKTKEIVDFHLRNGGMSRFEKFRYIYANILQKPLPEEEFNRLCGLFGKLVFEKVIASSLVRGVENFLQFCLGKYPMYVISATPDEEIKEIVRRKGLNKYFLKVEGAPRPKIDLLMNISKENNCRPSEVLFIGDSINDYNAAKGAGVKFIARAEEAGFEGRTPELFIKDFCNLEKYLGKW